MAVAAVASVLLDAAVLPVRKIDRAAAAFKGFGGRLKNLDEFHTLLAARQRGGPVPDAVQEVLALDLQRFLLFDVGKMHVAVVVGVLEFTEGIVVRRPLDPRVEYPDLFYRRDVVINNHPPAAHDRHLPHFSWVEPTALNDGGPLLWKAQPHGGHILHARRDVGAALAVYGHGLFPHDVQDDGDVMRRQVPGHVDVLLEQPQVEPPGANVADFTDVAGVHNLLNLPHGGRIKERVTVHQHYSLFLCDFDQLFALAGRAGHGLLDERVFAGQQARFGHRVMQPDGGGNDHRIETDAVQRVPVI